MRIMLSAALFLFLFILNDQFYLPLKALKSPDMCMIMKICCSDLYFVNFTYLYSKFGTIAIIDTLNSEARQGYL